MQPEIVFGLFLIVDILRSETAVILAESILSVSELTTLRNWLRIGSQSSRNEARAMVASKLGLVQASDVEDLFVTQKWGVRLTMPGHLDCTEWELYSTEGVAEQAATILEEEEQERQAEEAELYRRYRIATDSDGIYLIEGDDINTYL